MSGRDLDRADGHASVEVLLQDLLHQQRDLDALAVVGDLAMVQQRAEGGLHAQAEFGADGVHVQHGVGAKDIVHVQLVVERHAQRVVAAEVRALDLAVERVRDVDQPVAPASEVVARVAAGRQVADGLAAAIDDDRHLALGDLDG